MVFMGEWEKMGWDEIKQYKRVVSVDDDSDEDFVVVVVVVLFTKS